MTVEREFWRAGHWPTLLAAFLYFDVSFLLWMLVGSLAVFLSADLELTASQKGFLVALPLLSGACLRLLAGTLADRIGARRTAALGMSLTAVALLCGGLGVQGFVSGLCTAALLGVAGASFAVALPLASRSYPARYQGIAMGIAGAGNSGTVLAAFFAPRLAEWVGWRGVFLWSLIPLLITLVVFLLLAREPPSFARNARQPIAREPDLWWLCAFYMLTFGGFVGWSSFLPVLFSDLYGVPAVTAGTWTAACVLAGSALRPLGGWLADRWGGVGVLSSVYALAGGVASLIGLVPSPAAAVLLMVAMLGSLGAGNGAVFQLVGQRFPGAIGKATGIVGAAGGVGGFLLPSILGVVREISGSYVPGFGAFASAAVALLVALRWLERRWRWTLAVRRQVEPGVAH